MVVLFQESEDSEELEGVGWLAWEMGPEDIQHRIRGQEKGEQWNRNFIAV